MIDRPKRKFTGLLGNAIERVRDFAYAEQPAEQPAKRRKVGLALGGGFARGVAHLGVLHELERHQIPIDCIAGTSAGAVAGIAYATRLPFDEIVQKASAIRFGTFGQWRLSRMGLASNQRLENYPQHSFGVTDFEELKIPLAIAAADLMTGEPVYFTKGPLGPALRASCAYPGLFHPVEYQNRLLVDGFVAATVPVEAARLLGADIVIAVFLDAGSAEKPTSMTDVIGRSFSYVQRQADFGWRSKADLLIEPDVHAFAWDDFAKTPQLVTAGEAAGLAAVPQIEKLMQSGPSKDDAAGRLAPKIR